MMTYLSTHCKYYIPRLTTRTSIIDAKGRSDKINAYPPWQFTDHHRLYQQGKAHITYRKAPGQAPKAGFGL